MPGSGWSISFSGSLPWSDEEARGQYGAWLFANGLRDVTEAFGAFLDECHDIASLIRLVRKYKQNGVILGQDFFDHQADTLKFRQVGIDKKIDKLKPWLSTLPSDLQECIRSMNRARNILAHHEGIVPESYADTNGKFRITWRRLTLTALGPHEREVMPGDQLKAGEGLGLRTVSEYRDFNKGDRLHLEPVDFSGICWTVFITGDAIREILEQEWFKS